VKLLFDQNLSPYLIQALVDLYPNSIHVRNVGLERANDREVWNYARDGGFTIASKDSDLRQLSFLYGHPPKVVWIQRGNCSTGDIEMILRDRYDDLIAFELDQESSFLALK
jgi:predicted nuclease of predicted toxin-antitoxin system